MAADAGFLFGIRSGSRNTVESAKMKARTLQNSLDAILFRADVVGQLH